ncbi:preprotein translocase subunit YajC [Clostridiales bacterium F-3ap]|uniref:Preprotein translocase subunit YajC n=1 Tax=Anaerotalea alkaliphila TaxID=2662126 RepID=A0A7X5KM54_9FIRM|nr:preprotein translocase subunit YajC [Anaerotalea alkaliphila]
MTTIAAAQASGGESMLFTIGYLVLIFAFMYFVMIRPQKKKQKEVESMQNSVKIGDTVLTTGGMYGKVVDIMNNTLVLELGMNKGIRVPMVRSAVASVGEPNMSLVKEETKEDAK